MASEVAGEDVVLFEYSSSSRAPGTQHLVRDAILPIVKQRAARRTCVIASSVMPAARQAGGEVSDCGYALVLVLQVERAPTLCRLVRQLLVGALRSSSTRRVDSDGGLRGERPGVCPVLARSRSEWSNSSSTASSSGSRAARPCRTRTAPLHRASPHEGARYLGLSARTRVRGRAACPASPSPSAVRCAGARCP